MSRASFFAVSPAVFLGAVVLAGCPGPVAEICGQSTEVPDLASGDADATRSDGAAFNSAGGSWALAPSSSLVIGTLTMIMANDEAGLVVDDLIADGTFPICVPQGARSETSGQANLSEASDSFVTDASHDGGLALLAKDGDDLIGRFGFDMVSGDGATTLTFSDGVFRVPQRQP